VILETANMGYNTEATVWPTYPVATPVKDLIDRLFNLLDSHSPEVGDTLAEEIFTGDAKAQFGAHTFRGKDGLDPLILICVHILHWASI